MIIEYLPVTCQLLGTPQRWTTLHSSLGRTFSDRAQALAWAEEELDHDDFRIATLANGRLTAIGWGMDDFGPDDEEDLPAIARQLSLEVAHPAEDSFAPNATLCDVPDPMYPEGEGPPR